MPAAPRSGAHAAPRPLSRFALPAVLLGAIAVGVGGAAVTGAPAAEQVLMTYASSETRVVSFDPGPLLESFAAGAATPVGQAVAKDTKQPLARVQPKRASRSARDSAGPKWAAPLSRGRLTSKFGWRWGRAHQGIDIAVPTGTPVRATGAGKVVSAGWSSGYGKLVTVRHADQTVTAYAHLSSISASPGERVDAGEVVAYSGNTGRSTGPHLHFEVRIGGAQINPIAWLRKRGVSL